MSCSLKLTQFLDEHQVKYVTISHSRAYTAQEIAAAVHIPGKELAKSVIVQVNGDFIMVVLPATCKIKFDLLKSTLGKENVRLATVIRRILFVWESFSLPMVSLNNRTSRSM